MIEIAGGIILAVLFFAFLPVIIMLSVGIIGIGLLVILCVGIYFLSLNYVSSENAIFITFSIFVISFLVYNWKFAYKSVSDNDVNAVNRFYIFDNSSIERKNSISKYLLKKDGVNSVVICQSALKSIHLTASNNVQQLNKVIPFSAPFYAA